MTVDPLLFQVFERETVGVLRADLRSWALQVMLSGLPFEARIAARNRALRDAAAFLPAELCMAERVRQLHAELCALARSTFPAHPDPSTLRGCLALAMLARDRVPNLRQLRNALECD
ncbi:hypothetical protein NR798_28655 [Archangium gephyra]|uniref:hypothetical protein n=1 Tax=Archangium gephyra TaxID=48 RepID=UPI0035D405C1